MVRVYGHSDDIVAIENSNYEFDEIGCYCSNVRILFTDGTVILVSYDGCWYIEVEVKGTAEQYLGPNFLKDYTDVFAIDAEVVTHEVIDRR